jgi:hypothetical protein
MLFLEGGAQSATLRMGTTKLMILMRGIFSTNAELAA